MDHLEEAKRLAEGVKLDLYREQEAISLDAIAHALIALCERLDDVTEERSYGKAIQILERRVE